MANPLDELKKRFRRLAPSAPQVRPRSGKTRSDFKGNRKRLHVRLSMQLAESLELLARVRDVSQNEIVEELLSKSVAQALAIARQQVGETAWEDLKTGASREIGGTD